MDEMYGSPVAMEGKQLYFPTFEIDTEHLPEAKEWKVGKTYKVTLRVKQTGLSMRKSKDGKERGSASFDIVGIASGGESKSKNSRYAKED